MPTPLPDFQSGDKTTHTNREFQCNEFAVMQGCVQNMESSEAGRLLEQAQVR